MTGDKHEKAIDLTEAALEKLAEGDGGAADKLLDQARKLDPAAPEQVVKDLDEDAANHA